MTLPVSSPGKVVKIAIPGSVQELRNCKGRFNRSGAMSVAVESTSYFQIRPTNACDSSRAPRGSSLNGYEKSATGEELGRIRRSALGTT